MKRKFANPEIEISVFEFEVVTALSALIDGVKLTEEKLNEIEITKTEVISLGEFSAE